jgi:hypothetical protein
MSLLISYLYYVVSIYSKEQINIQYNDKLHLRAWVNAIMRKSTCHIRIDFILILSVVNVADCYC